MTTYTFKFRRDTASRWVVENPVLSDGEPGLEIDTGRFKIGDGIKGWMDLEYFIPQDPIEASNSTLPDHVNSPLPHPIYDDGPSLELLYQNAKV